MLLNVTRDRFESLKSSSFNLYSKIKLGLILLPNDWEIAWKSQIVVNSYYN